MAGEAAEGLVTGWTSPLMGMSPNVTLSQGFGIRQAWLESQRRYLLVLGLGRVIIPLRFLLCKTGSGSLFIQVSRGAANTPPVQTTGGAA